MTMFPHTVTIINRFNNRGRITEYFTEISNVFWEDVSSVSLGNEVHFNKDTGYIQIPNDYVSDKDYVVYSEWLKLEDKSTKWTLNAEDYVIKGTTTETNSDNLTDLRTIESVEDIDYGIPMLNHFGVIIK